MPCAYRFDSRIDYVRVSPSLILWINAVAVVGIHRDMVTRKDYCSIVVEVLFLEPIDKLGDLL